MKPSEILARAAQRALFAREPDGRYEIVTAKATGSTPSTARVQIYGAIGDWWDGLDAATLASQINDLDVDEIEVHLNSPGGIAFDGIAIFNALRQHKATVRVSVDGLAASAASIIAMAGDEVIMSTGSQMMIHNAAGLCFGKAQDMRDVAEILDKISGSISTIYATRGRTAADWQTAMDAETWYTAEEAVAAGLADAVDKAAPVENVEASFDLSIFAYAGRSKAAPPAFPDFRANKPPAEPADHPNPNQEGLDTMSKNLISGLRERLGIRADAELDEDGLLAALDETLAEQAETTPAAALPAGTVAIDQGTLEGLRADAQLGRAAREEQLADRRAAAVENAINTGRIPPAKRDQWLNTLKVDPSMEETLNGLAAGLVPVDTKGYTGGVEEATDDDEQIFVTAWPTSAGKKA